jgi:cell division protein FtsQ
MDRTLAGRSPIALPLPRLGAGLGSVRGALGSLPRHTRARNALLALLAAVPVLAGGWLWLRQSPFVAVRHVQIGGVHGPDAGAIDAALRSAAAHMSTLDVHSGVLREAVASYPVVREVWATPRFPHGLRIHVIEQLPVAALVVYGSRTAVAADGVVLGPGLLSSSLPSVTGYFQPPVGHAVSGPNVLASLAVMGAAPAPLAHLVTRLFTGAEGLTVAMRSGLLAYFGDDTRPHAKWYSLARVLADPSSKGASYVDVRLPGRPAAGFPAGVSPPDASASEAGAGGEVTSASEATVSSLAASLASSAGGGASTSTSGSTSASTTGAQSSSEPSETQATTPQSPSEGASTPTTEAPTSTPATGG